jgi:putative transposase
MPWNISSLLRERWRLVQALLSGQQSVARICRRAGVSRKTAYKWRARFLRGGRVALRDRPRRPKRVPARTSPRLLAQLKRLRQKQPSWGARKLRVRLKAPRRSRPCARTLARWLRRLGLVRPRRRRPPRAGVRRHPKLTRAHRPNQVWTVDFKGCFRTGNGKRVDPLTVRDLFSRFGLAAQLLADQRWWRVQAVFVALFRRYGVPERIRVDHGGPFASSGPGHLSRLSVWWTSLGIRVEFIRPGCPQDNGAHEQFHRVLKAETARPPAPTPGGQQRRTTRWLRHYNEQRPHEALGQRVPAQFYRPRRRRWRGGPIEWRYPQEWAVRRVRSNGEIRWGGRRRFVGEAFVGQRIGLRPMRRRGIAAVYFAKLLLGHLHASDAGGLRPILYQHERVRTKKQKV